MMALSRSFEEVKRLIILQKWQRIRCFYGSRKTYLLDKLVTGNTSPVFQLNPPVKETEKPISVTRSGGHARFPDRNKV